MIFEKIYEHAKIPTKNHMDDAGWDLYTPEKFTLNSSEIKLLRLGFRLSLPSGTAGILMGRSGLGVRGIDALEFLEPETNRLLGGLIDSGYCGEWGVVLKNLGPQSVDFLVGDKVCQFIVVLLNDDDIVEGSVNKSRGRGERGFGSSDIVVKSKVT